MSKTVLFQVIQFSISTHFSSIWPINWTLTGATTPEKSGPVSDGNEGVLHIPQRSSITGNLPSDCLVSYPGHLLGVGNHSAEKQSMYSTALADWTRWVFMHFTVHKWSSYLFFFLICISFLKFFCRENLVTVAKFEIVIIGSAWSIYVWVCLLLLNFLLNFDGKIEKSFLGEILTPVCLFQYFFFRFTETLGLRNVTNV